MVRLSLELARKYIRMEGCGVCKKHMMGEFRYTVAQINKTELNTVVSGQINVRMGSFLTN